MPEFIIYALERHRRRDEYRRIQSATSTNGQELYLPALYIERQCVRALLWRQIRHNLPIVQALALEELSESRDTPPPPDVLSMGVNPSRIIEPLRGCLP